METPFWPGTNFKLIFSSNNNTNNNNNINNNNTTDKQITGAGITLHVPSTKTWTEYWNPPSGVF